MGSLQTIVYCFILQGYDSSQDGYDSYWNQSAPATDIPTRGPPAHIRRDFRGSDRGHMQHGGHEPPSVPEAAIGIELSVLLWQLLLSTKSVDYVVRRKRT